MKILMKRNIVFLIIGVLIASACGDRLSVEEEAYVDAISKICMEWGADKQAVANYMEDVELKYESSSAMDYFLSDEDHIVIYNFKKGGLASSVLRVRGKDDVSVNSILGGWEYLGSSLEDDEGTLITSMVDMYVKEDKELIATTYTIEHKNITYRIIGFSTTKGL